MILINGQNGDNVSVLDRGFQYGDGLFETCAVVAGRPLLWAQHLARLERGCARLSIPVPSRTLLETEVQQVCAGYDRAVLKIIVTRGIGGRGYAASQGNVSTRAVMCFPWPDYPARYTECGVAVRRCATRLGISPHLAGLKHLGRLEQVLARAEWDDPAVAEGILCDVEGRAVEGTMSNLFLIRRGRLITPALSRCGVAGVMREQVLACAARKGLECEQRDVDSAELDEAEGLFMTNSLIGLWPIRRLDERELAVHPTATALLTGLREERACV